MPAPVAVRRVRPGDMAAVRALDAAVRREMARNETIILLWRLARHPWPYCLLGATWGAVHLLTKLPALQSLSFTLLVVGVEEVLRFQAFWRQVSRLFGAAVDVQNALTFYSEPKRAFFVADADGEVVGTLALRPHPPHSEEGAREEAKLLRITVHHRHRLLGVASRLLQEAAEEARRLGFQSIVIRTHTTNTRAINCYCRNGYKKVHVQNFARFYPHTMEAVLLRLELV